MSFFDMFSSVSSNAKDKFLLQYYFPKALPTLLISPAQSNMPRMMAVDSVQFWMLHVPTAEEKDLH